MRTQLLFISSALLLASCAQLTSQTLPVEDISKTFDQAKTTARDTVELGKLGVGKVKNTVDDAKNMADQAASTATKVQQGAAEIVGGIEKVQAAVK